MAGFGTSIPPERGHVIIYFIQKKATEADALAFFMHQQKKRWKNRRSKKIANWKIAAWEWIMKLPSP